ncbi:MAG: response regulator [Pseudoflavonifractor sp.]|nr:response regulator [Alloprevotella sp.]MCM1116217.1 response regulator [Pseudoflavonifractor sp.]
MKILVIDDNPAVRLSLKMVLKGEFDEIVTVGDPHALPGLIDRGGFDGVLLDMNFDASRLDGSDGLFWLERIKGMAEAPAVVVVTAFASVPLAVEAMRLGAEDFVTKPWDNAELISKLRRAIALNRRARAEELSCLRAKELAEEASRRDALTLHEMKREHVESVVKRCDGNLSLAAARLGINRQTLYNIIRRP